MHAVLLRRATKKGFCFFILWHYICVCLCGWVWAWKLRAVNKWVLIHKTWYLRIQVGTLLHKRADSKPKRVRNWKLILYGLVLDVAGVRVVPFVGWESRYYEHCYRNQYVSGKYVQPNIHRQRIHKRKQPRLLAFRHLQ